MLAKKIDLDAVPERQKNIIIASFLTLWLIGTIYFQDIINLI